MQNLISKWVPLEEKSQLGALIYAGKFLEIFLIDILIKIYRHWISNIYVAKKPCKLKFQFFKVVKFHNTFISQSIVAPFCYTAYKSGHITYALLHYMGAIRPCPST